MASATFPHRHIASNLGFCERIRLRLATALHVDLTHTQKRYAACLQQYVQPGCQWLDVGAGRQIVPEWAMPDDHQRKLVERAGSLIGIDVDQAIFEHALLSRRVVAYGNRLPFRPQSFTLVTANMVIEHVDDPKQFLDEVYAVLQPGGRFIFHTTNFCHYLVFTAHYVPDFLKHRIVWLLERRKALDVFPTLYRCNSVTHITQLAAETGFDIEKLTLQGSPGLFAAFGPVGWLEVLIAKALALFQGGRYNSNILCTLRRR